MYAVEILLVIGEGESNKLEVGTSIDTIDHVVGTTRDFVKGPLRKVYPALYSFTEFGLQAVESFAVAMTGGSEYTATIGVADLTDVPVINRELAAQIAGNFVTALHVHRGTITEPALKLLGTQYEGDLSRVSFKVEPGEWLHRHLRGDDNFDLPSIKA